METVMIKAEFDHSKLKELGYSYAMIEGGYVSKDLATIVIINRSPYEREVMQYIPNAETNHMENVKKLKQIGAIE
ncbi:hypothetical protein CON36_33100 [Bacillus cereus]|uniref:Uncharacterized protein n=1 Tax=Bacillus cereus TaxID=1396 RepID=A0A9X6SSX8_BACCE|nr:hypothetical protein [Bacillus cereus]PDZ94573.1 hypothetical protein CON36_33100 [Bacillus cereus]PGP14423.1 hypothetical protein COA01_29090 [Bacillus cereus]